MKTNKAKAKLLLKQYREGHPPAVAAVEAHVKACGPFKRVGLQAIQEVIAREKGFRSWVDMLRSHRD